MYTRLAKLSLVLVVFAAVLGCSSLARWEYSTARSLERQGRMRAAIPFYESSLRHIPKEDVRWRSETYFRLGECLWAENQPGEAFASFQLAVDADSSNMGARLRLGEVFLAGGVPERASEQAVAVLQASNANTEALALLGAASTATGQDVVAEAAFRKVLERDPGRVSIAVALAELLNRRDREDDAREVLRTAAENESGSALPLLALGRLEEQQGNVYGAEQAYRQAVEREDTPDVNMRLAHFLERSSRISEAETVLKRVDQLRPRSPSALADFHLLSGRAPMALEQYWKAMRSQLLQAESRRGDERSTELGRGRAAMAARIVESDLQGSLNDIPAEQRLRARQHLQQFRDDMDSATVVILEAELALAEGDTALASSQAIKAVELAPRSAASQYVLGLVMQRRGAASQARSAWLQALDKDSSFVPARLALTEMALSQGDVAGAEQFVLPAVREEPANAKALILYARLLLAARNLGAAAVIANRSIAINNKSAEPHVLLGEIALRQKRYADALLQFQWALSLETKSRDAVEGLVRVYRQGKITRAMLRRMEVLARATPQSAVLMEIAGRLYAERGWTQDAERALRQAIEMDSKRDTATAALAQLSADRGHVDRAVELVKSMDGKTAALVSGLAAQNKNDWEAAIVQYEQAVRDGDRSGMAANNLAWLYAQKGERLDRALDLAEQARVQAPREPAVLDTLGVVHMRRREYSRAIAVLKDAISLASSSSAQAGSPALIATIRRHLSEAHLRAGLPVPR